MSLIDDIRRDADSGTKDYHWIGRTLMAKEFGEVVELFNADWSALDEFEAEHKRRIARVPDLERALLAAEELAAAVSHERNMVCQDLGMQLQASEAVEAALAAYREATQ